MIGKGSLPVIRAHYEQQEEVAYRLSHDAAGNGSSTACGTYSTANYWVAQGARALRKANRAISLQNRLADRIEERIQRARWERMEQTLREAYPTCIPKEWLK